MNWLHDIEPGPEVPEVVNVIIEIPKGSQNKYEYDKKNNIIKLDRVLYSPFHYPGDYGFIPRTHCEDGDPLDGIILVTEPSYPGVLIEARPVALLKMVDTGEPDDKILLVPAEDPRFEAVKDINDVPKHILDEIAHFFKRYKELQGKEVVINGWKGAAEAKRMVEHSMDLYKRKFGK